MAFGVPSVLLKNTGEGVVRSAKVIQVLDYYPFGEQRLNEQYGNFDEKKKFTGHEYDAETGLNYMVSRYQNGTIGRFISVDPASQNSPEKFLDDPQRLNSYSYTRNNPINLIDPTGLYDTKNGIVEKGDTPDIIVNAINNAFNIKTNWATVQEVSFYNDRFKGQSLDQIVGQSLWVGANITTNITQRLNNVTTDIAKEASELGSWSLIKFRPGGEWDLKSSGDAVFSGRWNDGERIFKSYIYSGELIRYDAPGNICYGYVASSLGFRDWVVQGGARAAQIADNLYHEKGLTFKDNSGDAKYVQKGINLYKSTRSWLQKLLNF